MNQDVGGMKDKEVKGGGAGLCTGEATLLMLHFGGRENRGPPNQTDPWTSRAPWGSPLSVLRVQEREREREREREKRELPDRE